jgi:hypothetical protein
MLELSPDIGPLFHNCEVYSIKDCAAQFLNARFTWLIFPGLSGFLSKPGIRRTMVRIRSDERGRAREVVEFTEMEYIKVRASASRGSSPKKRARAAKGVDDVGDGDGQPGRERVKRKRRVDDVVPTIYPRSLPRTHKMWICMES